MSDERRIWVRKGERENREERQRLRSLLVDLQQEKNRLRANQADLGNEKLQLGREIEDLRHEVRILSAQSSVSRIGRLIPGVSGPATAATVFNEGITRQELTA